ncbi:MAG TPA: DUF2127 domain-containing protein [Gemmatimonadales bacterium]|nr:DUF2127 domain-containing protein [Gemmatimonadales bacterium]
MIRTPGSSRERLARRLFDLGIILKGIDGILEIAGGFVFAFVRPETLNAVIRALTANELSEDPSDVVANFLRHTFRHISASTTLFAAAYLMVHGLTKVGLVAGLLRDKRWAYPAALVVLGAFTCYQIYRFALAHSPWLGVLTVFDIAVIALIWNEYRLRRKSAVDASERSDR